MNGYNLSGGLYFILLILILSACKNDTPKQELEEPEILPGELSFELREFERKLESCETDSMYCANVKAVYPMAKSGETSICKNINDTIFYYLRESLSVLAVSREEVLQSLDSIARQFFSDYEQLVVEGSDYLSPWTVETLGKVLYQSPEYISVELANYSSTGEAHPNTYTTLLNFDASTGRKLELEDLLGDIKQIETIVEQKFRSIHNLTEGEDLNEAGFFWDRDFYLPANFAVTDQGFYFYYNAYEAAAYAIGPTELIVSTEELTE